jgi:RNA polymerase sigma-70 factor, ECF subfamily
VEPQLDPTSEPKPGSPKGSSPGQGATPDDARPDLTARERRALPERDAAALDRFYEVYFDRIYGYVRRLLREEHLAEDITQDIFMHLHRSFSSYDPERELRPWVFTIATNKVRDYWRSRRHRDRRREVGVDDEDGGAYAVAVERGPGEMIEVSELSEHVAAAIDQLPDSMKSAFVMRYYEDLSFAEIGDALGRGEVAIRKRYSRALSELRELLEPYVGPEISGEGV